MGQHFARHAADSPYNAHYDRPAVLAALGLAGTIPLTATDSATITAERTWGWDWLWPHFADYDATSEADFAVQAIEGTGGGFSALEATPAYQQLANNSHRFTATQYLTPTDPETVAPGLTEPTTWAFNPTPPVTTGQGNGRATPDISADADPFTGYQLYFTFGDQPATLHYGWGGTSFVAPQLNGAAALMDSLLGRRIGFWNPASYLSATGHKSPFTPLDTAGTTNDNLYYTGTPGHIYNVGSGLGTPDLSSLYNILRQR